jgi:geranylgeranyl pyrophosphate synthase
LSIAEFKSGFLEESDLIAVTCVLIEAIVATDCEAIREVACVFGCKFKAADDISKVSTKEEELGDATGHKKVNIDVVQ